MKVAIDVSPLRNGDKSGHKVRGIGSYVEQLLSSLQARHRQDTYLPFASISDIPEAADLVHFTYFDPYFINLPLVKKKKYIVTVHDMIPLLFPTLFPPGVKGRLRWLIQKRLLTKADHIICVSNASKRDVVKIANVAKEKITVVYNAASEKFGRRVDASILKDVRKKYNLPAQFALYVGDVTPNKNVPRLIRSLAPLSLSLVLVGKALSEMNFDPENKMNIDLVAVSNLVKNNPKVLRLGFVSEEDLAILYQLATVFVMPSLYEGFGLPVLEAMKSGCPVITSNCGSLPEVTGDAAIVIDPQDEESIRKGVAQVLSSAALQKSLSVKGKIQAEKFSWSDTARFTQEVYSLVYNL